MVQLHLHKWRLLVRQRDFEDALFASAGFLGDETLELLSSVGPVASVESLRLVLGGNWIWFEKYGSELWEEMKKLDIPPMIPKAKAPRSKRTLENTEEDVDMAPVNKRGRTQTNTLEPIPTRVTSFPVPTPITASPAPITPHVVRNPYFATYPPATPLPPSYNPYVQQYHGYYPISNNSSPFPMTQPPMNYSLLSPQYYPPNISHPQQVHPVQFHHYVPPTPSSSSTAP